MNKLVQIIKRVKTSWWVGLGLLLTGFTIARDDLFEIRKSLEIFSAVYRQINRNYVDAVNLDDLLTRSINAMLEDLDPYTEYIPENEMENFRQRYVKTQYSGIGARVLVSDSGQVYLADVFEGGPAYQAGLQVGDELLAVNGQAIKATNPTDVSQLLKGEAGTAVVLRAKKVGSDSVALVEAVRAEISQSNISFASLTGDGIGYIKLDRFLADAANEVHAAIEALDRQKHLNGLILDLRDNGGGILQESVRIINLFVHKGIEVVKQTNQRTQETVSYITDEAPLKPNLPLVILINENSASASEIVAGALQDLDRAVILGQRSFGKGLVQQTFRLPYNNMVKITVAKYYTPSGRCIQALDYAHRGIDGRANKIDDTLIEAFKTKNGRAVYNGSGIFPDISIENPSDPELVKEAVRQLFVFKFANDYQSRHKTIHSLNSFVLEEEELQRFLDYLSRQHFAYQSDTDKLLRQLHKTVEETGQERWVANELDALKLKLGQGIRSELQLRKGELRKKLEQEIISRYYFQKGKQEYLCARDEQILNAIAMLSADKKMVYHDILKGNGAYGVIGGPNPNGHQLLFSAHPYSSY